MYLYKKSALKLITSPQNPFIKSLLLLQEKSKARKQSGTFLIEGKREIELAMNGGYAIDSILYLPEYLFAEEISKFQVENIELIEVSREVYQKLAYRETTEGLIAVAQMKSHLLSDLKLSENPLILVAEAPEKPGNIGAILRTADAANLDAVIIANPNGDLYSPNIVRASVGCLFTNQVAIATTDEIVNYLATNNIKFYSATLQDSEGYHLQDYTQPTAMVVGTESTGLSEKWRTAAAKNVLIPMQGAIDSMNVSVAAAILIFEAKRQRDFK